KDVTLTPQADTVITGQTLQLSATARDSNHVAIPGPLAWQSSNGGVAEVSQTGLVTANGIGRVSILATRGDRSGLGQVWVTWAGGTDNDAPQLGSITIDPTTVTLAQNFTTTVGINAVDSGSGVHFASMLLRLTGSDFDAPCTATNPAMGAANNGTWRCNFSRAMLNRAGTYYVERVDLTDFAGRRRTYLEAELAASGNRATVTVTP
ncbi:MAG TPA: Ig-like domain-containing protein, partial [Longimicrobium sp.]|nr:Ig-like domain-containing protein [Longimicrobium sp.]